MTKEDMPEEFIELLEQREATIRKECEESTRKLKEEVAERERKLKEELKKAIKEIEAPSVYLTDMSHEEIHNECIRRCTEREERIKQAIEDVNGNLNEEILWHEKCIGELKLKTEERENIVRQRYERVAEARRKAMRDMLNKEDCEDWRRELLGELLELDAVRLEMMWEILRELNSRDLK